MIATKKGKDQLAKQMKFEDRQFDIISYKETLDALVFGLKTEISQYAYFSEIQHPI